MESKKKSKYEILTEWPNLDVERFQNCQEPIINRIASECDKNYLLRVPAGIGKTLIGYGTFYKRMELGNIPPDSKVLILVPRPALAHQVWRDLGKLYGVEKTVGDKIYINNMNSYNWKLYRQTAAKHSTPDEPIRARDLYRENLEKATFIISTPTLFMKNLKYMKEAGIDKKIKLVILDEVQTFSSIDRMRKNANRFDIVESMSPSRLYEAFLNEFLRNPDYNAQVIGLTAIMDRDERQMSIEHSLKAEALSLPENIAKKYMPVLRRHQVKIDDPEVFEAVNLLFEARGKCLEAITDGIGVFWYKGAKAIDDPAWGDLLGNILFSRNPKTIPFKWDAYFSLALTHQVIPEIYATVETRCLVEKLDAMESELFKPFDEVNEERFNFAFDNWQKAMTYLREASKTRRFTTKAIAMSKFAEAKVVEPGALEVELDAQGILKPKIGEEKLLIFTRRVDSAEQLARLLSVHGSARCLSGKDKDMQSEILHAFKEGEFRILVTTDRLAGRGFDLYWVNAAFDYDFIANPAEAYQRASRIRGGDFYHMIYKHTSEEKKFELATQEVRGVGETTVEVPGTTLIDIFERADEESLQGLMNFGEDDEEADEQGKRNKKGVEEEGDE